MLDESDQLYHHTTILPSCLRATYDGQFENTFATFDRSGVVENDCFNILKLPSDFTTQKVASSE